MYSGCNDIQTKNTSYDALGSYLHAATQHITDYLSKAQHDPDTYQLKFIHDELSLLLSLMSSPVFETLEQKEQSWHQTRQTLGGYIQSHPSKTNYLDIIKSVHHHELPNNHPLYPSFVQDRNQLLFNLIKNKDDDPLLEYEEDSFTPRFLNQRGIFHFDTITDAYLSEYVYTLPSYCENQQKKQQILSHAQGLPYLIKEVFEQTYDSENVEQRFSQEIKTISSQKE